METQAEADAKRIEYLSPFLPLARFRRVLAASEALAVAVRAGRPDLAYAYTVLLVRAGTKRKR